MNLNLPRKIYLLVPLLLLGVWGLKGQNFDPLFQLTYLQGQAVSYSYQSLGNPPSNIVSQTNHLGGNYFIQRTGISSYKLLSQTLNTVGKDTVTIFYKKPPQGAAHYRTFEITVLPSYLAAKDDYITTGVNQSITIPVTANDTSNRGVKILTDVAVNTNGTVSVSGNQVVFTPLAGFEGFASLNYVVCDDLGTCDAGTAYIAVGDPYGHQTDTLRITTIKNQKVPVFTPVSNYTLTSSPAHGSFSTIGGITYFQPNAGYVGLDEAVYTHNTLNITKTLQIDVLNHNGFNQYLEDDVFFTSRDADVEVDLLANDLGYTALYNVQIVSQPENGTLTYLSEGLYLYQPDSGFDGVDEFTYQASPNSNGSNPETAKASVIVSDLNPSAPVFNLRTPKNTALVINYNIPIENFDFTITSQGTKGNTLFFPGNHSVNIGGKVVTGYNLLIYYPDNNKTGLDEVEIKYCIQGNNNCPTVKLRIDIQNLTPPPGGFCLDTDCVWAGDANKDGKVDLRDVLPIGLCMGEVGKPRPNASINPWYGQDCIDWDAKIPGSSIDIKHLDSDGDSIITALDTLAVSQHYQLTHSLSPQPVNFPTNIPLYLGAPDTTFVSGPGDIVSIPIMLGNEIFPAMDIYGLTFSIDFNTNIIDPNQSYISFDRNSWMSYTSPVLNMVKKPFDGRMEAAYTRTNGASTDGYGQIATVHFIIVDDLDPGRVPELKSLVRINSSVGMGSNGLEFGFQNFGASIVLEAGKKASGKDISSDQFLVYPNPSHGQINLHLNGGYQFDSVELLDISGRLVYTERLAQSGNSHQLNIGNLDNGVYILRAWTDGGVVVQRVNLIKE